MPQNTHHAAHDDSAEHVNELTFAQAQAAHTARCAPFCGSKDHHAADPTADDGGCWSDDFATALNNTPWVAGFPVIASVSAYRSGQQGDPTIWFTLRSTGHYDETAVKLTADEARRIARHLLAVADLAGE